LIAIPKHLDDIPYLPPELQTARFKTGESGGRVFQHLRELQRRQGVRPGAKLRFHDGATKTEFWEVYPQDELAFRAFVLPGDPRDPGIQYVVPAWAFVERRPLKPNYCGVPLAEIERLWRDYREDKEGFADTHTPEERQAFEAFGADLVDREQDYFDRRFEIGADGCPPTAPEGYHWRVERGTGGCGVFTLEVDELSSEDPEDGFDPIDQQ